MPRTLEGWSLINRITFSKEIDYCRTEAVPNWTNLNFLNFHLKLYHLKTRNTFLSHSMMNQGTLVKWRKGWSCIFRAVKSWALNWCLQPSRELLTTWSHLKSSSPARISTKSSCTRQGWSSMATTKKREVLHARRLKEARASREFFQPLTSLVSQRITLQVKTSKCYLEYSCL